MKKITFFILVISLFTMSGSFVSAMTSTEIEAQILSLESQISKLQSQIMELKKQQVPTKKETMKDKARKVVNLNQIQKSIISLGSTGEKVLLLQTLLNEKGFLLVKPTGYFGSKTLEAIKAFQRSKDMIPTGVYDATTALALDGSNNSASGSLSVCNTTTAPYIKVNYPNGGEIFSNAIIYGGGEITKIDWEYCNLPNEEIKIELLQGTSAYTITSNLPVGGERPYDSGLGIGGTIGLPMPLISTIGMNYGTDFKIKISLNSNSSIFDLSDGNFALQP